MRGTASACVDYSHVISHFLTCLCVSRWQDLLWPRAGALAFRDRHLEAHFRHYWERLSHPLAVLASLVLLVRYLNLARSSRELCQMPAAICTLRWTSCMSMQNIFNGRLAVMERGMCSCVVLSVLSGYAQS